MEKIEKINELAFLSTSIGTILNSMSCGCPYSEQNINDFDIPDMFDDDSDDS